MSIGAHWSHLGPVGALVVLAGERALGLGVDGAERVLAHGQAELRQGLKEVVAAHAVPRNRIDTSKRQKAE